MSDNTFSLLKELTEAAGIPGQENAIREIITRELKDRVDDIAVDTMGNLIASRKGQSRKPQRIMYSAHMDEIGFIVRHIDDKGFLRLQPLGGHDPRHTIIQRVMVYGKAALPGVVYWTCKPLHVQTPEDKTRTVDLNDCFVDIGLPERKAKKLVRPGDMVVIQRETERMGELYTGKAMDNRTAVCTLISALKRAKSNRHDVYAVFTTQEEVGLRGAKTSSYHINPHIGVALDTTLACDTPGTDAANAITRLGDGVALTVMDGSFIADRDLLAEFEDLATKHKLKHQCNILPRGGTDAGSIHLSRRGVRSITISLPTRYIHSSIETVHAADMEAKIDLVTAYMTGK